MATKFYRQDQHIPDMQVADYACHAQQGDDKTHCGQPTRFSRVVNTWDFVSCPVCKQLRELRTAQRIGKVAA